MSEKTKVQTLIDEWGLPKFAGDAGVTYGAAKQMRRRSSIPIEYWPSLIASDRGQSLFLSSDRLLALHVTEAAPAEVRAA